MSFSVLTNFITMVFCSAVLVQSVRLMRYLRIMKGEAFGEMVGALDAATVQARTVLADLRETLRTDCVANARVIASGSAMREELTVMAGIADAVAERIVEAVSMSNPRSSAKSAADPSAKLPAKSPVKSAAKPAPKRIRVRRAPTPPTATTPMPAPAPAPASTETPTETPTETAA